MNNSINDLKQVLSKKAKAVDAIIGLLLSLIFLSLFLSFLINKREQKFPQQQNVEVGYVLGIGKDDSEITIPYNIDSSMYFTNPNGMVLNIKQVDSKDFKINYQGNMLSFSKMNQLPTKISRIILSNGKEVTVHWRNEPENKYVNFTHITSEVVVYDSNLMLDASHMRLDFNKVTNQKINRDKFNTFVFLSKLIFLSQAAIYLCLLLIIVVLSVLFITLPLVENEQYYGLNKAEFEFLSIISNLSLGTRKKLLHNISTEQNLDEKLDKYNIQLQRYFQIYRNKSKLYENIKQTNDFNVLVSHIKTFKDILKEIVCNWSTLIEQKKQFELLCQEINKTMNINTIKLVDFNYHTIIEKSKDNFFDITKHNFSNSEFSIFSRLRSKQLNMIFYLKNKSPEIYFNLDEYIHQNNEIIEQMKTIYFEIIKD